MLTKRDVHSITAFFRVCQQNNVSRDMEAEIMQYYLGLTSPSLMLLQFWTYHQTLDDDWEINEKFHKLFDLNMFVNLDDFYMSIIKHIVSVVDKIYSKYGIGETELTIYKDHVIVSSNEIVSEYRLNQLASILARNHKLSSDDFPMFDITCNICEVNLVKVSFFKTYKPKTFIKIELFF